MAKKNLKYLNGLKLTEGNYAKIEAVHEWSALSQLNRGKKSVKMLIALLIQQNESDLFQRKKAEALLTLNK